MTKQMSQTMTTSMSPTNDHRYSLVKAVEQRQEIDSPYVIGIPLTPQQEIFVGRRDISIGEIKG
jgi:DNA topoisomerase IA